MYLGKRTNGIFFIEYFDEDELKTRRVSTGCRNKKNALRFLKDFKSKLINRAPVKCVTISQFHTDYVKYMGSTFSKKYIDSINLSFNKLRIFLNKDLLLNQINVRMIQQFMSEAYSRTNYGTNLYMRTLKAAFSRAVEWEYIAENPFKKIKLPKTPKSFPLFINENELSKIVDNTKKQMLKDLFITAFYTGMRLGEITNLKWDAVDLDNKIITVKNDKDFTTKSKKERIIPLNPKILEILRGRKSKDNFSSSNYVFKNPIGIKLNENFVSKQFKEALRATDLNEKIHFHTLRHSFASNLAQKGISLYVIKELLGHEDISTTQIYSHLNKDSLFQAIQMM